MSVSLGLARGCRTGGVDDCVGQSEGRNAATTGPDRQRSTLGARVREVQKRYGTDHLVSRCMRRIRPELDAVITRTRRGVTLAGNPRREADGSPQRPRRDRSSDGDLLGGFGRPGDVESRDAKRPSISGQSASMKHITPATGTAANLAWSAIAARTRSTWRSTPCTSLVQSRRPTISVSTRGVNNPPRTRSRGRLWWRLASRTNTPAVLTAR